jgi:dinuclear metal center YbgI/SA1388 family protein
VDLATLTEYLDRYLRVREIPDEPTAWNGLQVENRGIVGSIVAAVDASQTTIDGVIRRAGAQALPTVLLVHHGLFWSGVPTVSGRAYRRLAALLAHDIAVYSAHIPLDVHPDVGNNHVLARSLGLSEIGPFDQYRGIAIGCQGRVTTDTTREALVRELDGLLSTRSRLLPGGPAVVDRVGIITGAAGSRIGAAREAGLDTFITGEGAHHTYFDAMELGVNVIYAGHYATEQVGVKALAAHVAERFALPWEFHDHPTGM